MTGTTHALAGMAAGRLCRGPWKAFQAGVISHAALDSLPHQDYSSTVGLLLDGCGVAATLVLAVLSEGPEALAGALGGVIPDLESLAHLGNPAAPKMFPSHWVEHRACSTCVGVAVELMAAAGALLLGYALGQRRKLPSASSTTGAVCRTRTAC